MAGSLDGMAGMPEGATATADHANDVAGFPDSMVGTPEATATAAHADDVADFFDSVADTPDDVAESPGDRPAGIGQTLSALQAGAEEKEEVKRVKEDAATTRRQSAPRNSANVVHFHSLLRPAATLSLGLLSPLGKPLKYKKDEQRAKEEKEEETWTNIQ